MVSRTFSSFALDGKPRVKTFAVNIGHYVTFPQCKCPFARAFSLLTMGSITGEAREEIQPWRELTGRLTSLERKSGSD
jgi:hypothetical protein